jgi:uncharacterized membrane protein
MPLLVIAGAAAAVHFTMGLMPARIASHFAAGGLPNAYMAHDNYELFMLAIVIGLPGIIALGLAAAVRSGGDRLRIPDRDYWLDPVRREATVAYLQGHMAWLGSGTALFLLALHLVLVHVNRLDPPRLATGVAAGLMLVPLATILLWVGALQRHFRRR